MCIFLSLYYKHLHQVLDEKGVSNIKSINNQYHHLLVDRFFNPIICFL